MVNPFQSKQITCPVCTEISEVSVLISEVFGKYYAVTQDKDQYVSQWKWTDEQWQHINPYLYAIVMCPKCFYSNFIDVFTSKQKSSFNRHMQHLKTKIDGISGIEKDLIAKIGNIFVTNQTNHTHESAILGMILTLYYHKLLMDSEKIENSLSVLGRLYLRLSWLYREHFGADVNNGTSQCGVTPIVSDMLATLRNFHHLNKQIENQIESMNSENSDQVYSIVLFLEEATKRLAEKTEEILAHVDAAKGEAGSEQASLIKKCYTIWNWVPKTEAEAVSKAAECFVHAASEDYNLSDKGTYQMLELCAYLYTKIGDKEGADKCLLQIINSCHKKRMQLMKKLQQKLSIAQKSDVEMEVKRLNTYIEDITYQYKNDESQQA